MKVYMAMMISCDGNRVGRTWATKVCSTREKADDEVRKYMESCKYPHMEGSESTKWRPAVVDGKSGLAHWFAGMLVYVEELDVQ